MKTLKEQRILRLEELAINAFPAILAELYDGWILRFSNGYTNRGNCVNPLYLASIDLPEKIAFCEEKYFKRNLPCVFKITEKTGGRLDHLLEERNYRIETPSYIMELSCDKIELNRKTDIQIDIQYTIDEKWLEGMFALTNKCDDATRLIARTMLMNIENQVICASIYAEEKMIACGLGVLEAGEVGLYSIAVLEEHRKNGFGAFICEKIIGEGKKSGASNAYLQVAEGNNTALRLYEKLGFQRSYTYWYRVKNNP